MMKKLPVPVKKIFAILSQLFFVLMIALGAGVIFHNVYYTPVKIVGASMEPTLFNNEFGIMDQHERTLNDLKRFDIVVVQQDPNLDRYIIKRIIGMPEETIQLSNEGLWVDEVMVEQPFLTDAFLEKSCLSNSIFACTAPLSLDDDEFFMLGDNRGASLDSRVLGSFTRSQIIGKLIAIEGICANLNGSADPGVDLNNCASRQYQWPRLYL
jgi:signal peptidase I